jgi:hypothetical protein
MMTQPGFDLAHARQCRLAALNSARVTPGLPDQCNISDLTSVLGEESEFLAAARGRVVAAASAAPTDAKPFLAWFEALAHNGPGQGDSLFAWLATVCTPSDMRWFLAQEVAGEAGFDDLVAMTLVGMPTRPKLELAANFWDEMGRGAPRGMHGPCFRPWQSIWIWICRGRKWFGRHLPWQTPWLDWPRTDNMRFIP